MDEKGKTGFGCLFLASAMLAAVFVSVAAGLLLGAGWGFLAMAAFMALFALWMVCAYRVERRKGAGDGR